MSDDSVSDKYIKYIADGISLIEPVSSLSNLPKNGINYQLCFVKSIQSIRVFINGQWIPFTTKDFPIDVDMETVIDIMES